jgi:hypothetical protein
MSLYGFGYSVMNHTLLPERGIFVPTQMIFNSQLPSVVLVTWLQLRCLAWRGWDTPPMSIPELASFIGIHPARLNRHLAQLQDNSALACRTTGDGKLILSFPAVKSANADNPPLSPGLSGAPGLNSKDRESSKSSSYFPTQIMGYLSFQKDRDEFDEPVELDQLMVVREKSEKCV